MQFWLTMQYHSWPVQSQQSLCVLIFLYLPLFVNVQEQLVGPVTGISGEGVSEYFKNRMFEKNLTH